MAKLEQTIQGFPEINEVPRSPLLEERLFNWAEELPSGWILDLAAGWGLEAKYLTDHDHPCIAYDASDYLTSHSLADDTEKGDVTKLRYKGDSFAGVMLINSLIFLSPWQRSRMFREVKRVLKRGGHFLIISQKNDYNDALLETDSQDEVSDSEWFPQGDDESFGQWTQRIDRLIRKGNKLIETMYVSQPDDIRSQATQAGLSLVSDELLSSDTRFVQEVGGRWRNSREPFIIMDFVKE